MTTNVRPYEGMFLISQATANDLQGAVDHIVEIINKAGGDIIAMRKWDERRLAYEIDKQKRGVYLLTYFNCPTDALTQIDRDCNLSETVMRMIVVKADHLTEEEMKSADARDELAVEAKMRAERAAQREAEQAQAVTVGAPQQQEEEPAQADSDEGDAGDAKED